MGMTTNPWHRALITAARSQGWEIGNGGEAKLALALHALDYTPANVATQFAIGPYRIDFAFPFERVAVEADGWVHTAANVRRRDKERDRQLTEWGWVTIRVDVQADIDREALKRALADAMADAAANAAGQWKSWKELDRRRWRAER
jgi:very-short-patch-repair endonuclease